MGKERNLGRGITVFAATVIAPLALVGLGSTSCTDLLTGAGCTRQTQRVLVRNDPIHSDQDWNRLVNLRRLRYSCEQDEAYHDEAGLHRGWYHVCTRCE
jgi:hypothetical protein